MKTAINTKTQEEYDALMRYYESKGRYIPSGWEIYKETFCIDTESLYIGSLGFFKELRYEIIPFTEFAKANIVEEIVKIDEYQIVREFMDYLPQLDKFPKEQKEACLLNFKQYRTKHKETPSGE